MMIWPLVLGAMTVALVAACSPLRLVNAFVPRSGYELAPNLPYGESPRHRLDVYRPRGVNRDAPVVVFFYGGAWQSGDRGEYRFAAEALASQGFVAVVADYRLYPSVTFPRFVEDGALAVRWVRERIAAYGGDPSRIFLMGHSAGGYIAALLALDGRYLASAGVDSSAIRGVIGVAGPYDFLPLRTEVMKRIFGPAEGWPTTQPINFVTGREPPMLLITGGADQRVGPGNTRRLAARVRDRGGRVEEVVYPGVGHSGVLVALARPLRRWAPVLRDVADFVRSH